MKRAILIMLLSTAMLFVLAGIAAIVFFTVRGGNPFKDGNQPSATQDVNKALKIDAENPVTLKVIDDAGAVNINSANVDQVQVKVVLTAHANTEAAARAELKNIKYDIQQSGNNITLTYDLPNTVLIDFNLDLVDFFVTVPLETSVNITNNLGEVDVRGIRGDVAI